MKDTISTITRCVKRVITRRCCRKNFPLRSKFAAERGVKFHYISENELSKEHSVSKSWAYIVVYSGLFGIGTVWVILFNIVPSYFYEIPLKPIIGVGGLAFWWIYLTTFTPRCPKCGQGLFSIIEIGRVPIIIKSWVSNSCLGCGFEFDE